MESFAHYRPERSLSISKPLDTDAGIPDFRTIDDKFSTRRGSVQYGLSGMTLTPRHIHQPAPIARDANVLVPTLASVMKGKRRQSVTNEPTTEVPSSDAAPHAPADDPPVIAMGRRGSFMRALKMGAAMTTSEGFQQIAIEHGGVELVAALPVPDSRRGRTAEQRMNSAARTVQVAYRAARARLLLRKHRYQRWLDDSWTFPKLFCLYIDAVGESFEQQYPGSGSKGRHRDETDALDCAELYVEKHLPDNGPLAHKGVRACLDWHIAQAKNGQATARDFLLSRDRAAKGAQAELAAPTREITESVVTPILKLEDLRMSLAAWLLMCFDSNLLTEHRSIRFLCEVFKVGCKFEKRMQAIEEMEKRTGGALGFREHHFAALVEQASDMDELSKYGHVDALTASFLPRRVSGSALKADPFAAPKTETADNIPVWHQRLTPRAACYCLYLIALLYMKKRYKYDHAAAKQASIPPLSMGGAEQLAKSLFEAVLRRGSDSRAAALARFRLLEVTQSDKASFSMNDVDVFSLFMSDCVWTSAQRRFLMYAGCMKSIAGLRFDSIGDTGAAPLQGPSGPIVGLVKQQAQAVAERDAIIAMLAAPPKRPNFSPCESWSLYSDSRFVGLLLRYEHSFSAIFHEYATDKPHTSTSHSFAKHWFDREKVTLSEVNWNVAASVVSKFQSVQLPMDARSSVSRQGSRHGVRRQATDGVGVKHMGYQQFLRAFIESGMLPSSAQQAASTYAALLRIFIGCTSIGDVEAAAQADVVAKHTCELRAAYYLSLLQADRLVKQLQEELDNLCKSTLSLHGSKPTIAGKNVTSQLLRFGYAYVPSPSRQLQGAETASALATGSPQTSPSSRFAPSQESETTADRLVPSPTVASDANAFAMGTAVTAVPSADEEAVKSMTANMADSLFDSLMERFKDLQLSCSGSLRRRVSASGTLLDTTCYQQTQLIMSKCTALRRIVRAAPLQEMFPRLTTLHATSLNRNLGSTPAPTGTCSVGSDDKGRKALSLPVGFSMPPLDVEKTLAQADKSCIFSATRSRIQKAFMVITAHHDSNMAAMRSDVDTASRMLSSGLFDEVLAVGRWEHLWGMSPFKPGARLSCGLPDNVRPPKRREIMLTDLLALFSMANCVCSDSELQVVLEDVGIDWQSAYHDRYKSLAQDGSSTSRETPLDGRMAASRLDTPSLTARKAPRFEEDQALHRKRDALAHFERLDNDLKAYTSRRCISMNLALLILSRVRKLRYRLSSSFIGEAQFCFAALTAGAAGIVDLTEYERRVQMKTKLIHMLHKVRSLVADANLVEHYRKVMPAPADTDLPYWERFFSGVVERLYRTYSLLADPCYVAAVAHHQLQSRMPAALMKASLLDETTVQHVDVVQEGEHVPFRALVSFIQDCRLYKNYLSAVTKANVCVSLRGMSSIPPFVTQIIKCLREVCIAQVKLPHWPLADPVKIANRAELARLMKIRDHLSRQEELSVAGVSTSLKSEVASTMSAIQQTIGNICDALSLEDFLKCSISFRCFRAILLALLQKEYEAGGGVVEEYMHPRGFVPPQWIPSGLSAPHPPGAEHGSPWYMRNKANKRSKTHKRDDGISHHRVWLWSVLARTYDHGRFVRLQRRLSQALNSVALQEHMMGMDGEWEANPEDPIVTEESRHALPSQRIVRGKCVRSPLLWSALIALYPEHYYDANWDCSQHTPRNWSSPEWLKAQEVYELHNNPARKTPASPVEDGQFQELLLATGSAQPSQWVIYGYDIVLQYGFVEIFSNKPSTAGETDLLASLNTWDAASAASRSDANRRVARSSILAINASELSLEGIVAQVGDGITPYGALLRHACIRLWQMFVSYGPQKLSHLAQRVVAAVTKSALQLGVAVVNDDKVKQLEDTISRHRCTGEPITMPSFDPVAPFIVMFVPNINMPLTNAHDRYGTASDDRSRKPQRPGVPPPAAGKGSFAAEHRLARRLSRIAINPHGLGLNADQASDLGLTTTGLQYTPDVILDPHVKPEEDSTLDVEPIPKHVEGTHYYSISYQLSRGDYQTEQNALEARQQREDEKAAIPAVKRFVVPFHFLDSSVVKVLQISKLALLEISKLQQLRSMPGPMGTARATAGGPSGASLLSQATEALQDGTVAFRLALPSTLEVPQRINDAHAPQAIPQTAVCSPRRLSIHDIATPQDKEMLKAGSAPARPSFAPLALHRVLLPTEEADQVSGRVSGRTHHIAGLDDISWLWSPVRGKEDSSDESDGSPSPTVALGDVTPPALQRGESAGESLSQPQLSPRLQSRKVTVSGTAAGGLYYQTKLQELSELQLAEAVVAAAKRAATRSFIADQDAAFATLRKHALRVLSLRDSSELSSLSIPRRGKFHDSVDAHCSNTPAFVVLRMLVIPSREDQKNKWLNRLVYPAVAVEVLLLDTLFRLVTVKAANPVSTSPHAISPRAQTIHGSTSPQPRASPLSLLVSDNARSADFLAMSHVRKTYWDVLFPDHGMQLPPDFVTRGTDAPTESTSNSALFAAAQEINHAKWLMHSFLHCLVMQELQESTRTVAGATKVALRFLATKIHKSPRSFPQIDQVSVVAAPPVTTPMRLSVAAPKLGIPERTDVPSPHHWTPRSRHITLSLKMGRSLKISSSRPAAVTKATDCGQAFDLVDVITKKMADLDRQIEDHLKRQQLAEQSANDSPAGILLVEAAGNQTPFHATSPVTAESTFHNGPQHSKDGDAPVPNRETAAMPSVPANYGAAERIPNSTGKESAVRSPRIVWPQEAGASLLKMYQARPAGEPELLPASSERTRPVQSPPTGGLMPYAALLANRLQIPLSGGDQW